MSANEGCGGRRQLKPHHGSLGFRRCPGCDDCVGQVQPVVNSVTKREATRIIQQVVGSISDEEWDALAMAVLRRVAAGQAPQCSEETQRFAQELLEEREARIPDEE